MARFLSRQFEHGGRLYHVELSIDRLAALRDQLTIEIAARSYSAGGDGGVSIQASLSLDVERREIVIEVEGKELGRIPLDAVDIAEADEADVEGAEGFARRAWETLAEQLRDGDGNPAAETIEAIIGQIPAIDPLLGCLLKGAISASVGQTIRCYAQLEPEHETIRQKLSAVAACLGNNVWGMLGRATYRALRCMVAGGFG